MKKASPKLASAKSLLKGAGIDFYCDRGKTMHSIKISFVPCDAPLSIFDQLKSLADRTIKTPERIENFFDVGSNDRYQFFLVDE